MLKNKTTRVDRRKRRERQRKAAAGISAMQFFHAELANAPLRLAASKRLRAERRKARHKAEKAQSTLKALIGKP